MSEGMGGSALPQVMPKEPPENRATVVKYNPQEYARKFENGENVIFKIKVKGVWVSYDLTVGTSRLGASNKPEYTLLRGDGSMYDGGKYFKEADLKSA